MLPKVSVVVPTYRRPPSLERCLGALLRQDLAPREYDVVVVDDAAQETTREQVRRWSPRFARRGATLRYLPVAHEAHGPAIARNLGWHATAADIVAFTDDDCIPSRHWLRMGLSAFRHDVAAVSGAIMMPLPSHPTDYQLDAARLTSAEFATANCFCRRDALEAVGGFDIQFKRAWREDSDLQFSLLEHGYRIVKAPAAMVLHPIRPEPWNVSLRQVRKSEDEALLYKKHPYLYRQKIMPERNRLYYAILTALALSLLGAALQQATLFWGGLATWLALTGVFCAKRLHGTSRAPRHVAAMLCTSFLIPPMSIYYRIKGAIKHRVFFY